MFWFVGRVYAPLIRRCLLDSLNNSSRKWISQNEKNEYRLADAKNRAQLTATTAMSVVHVTLLRTVLSGGPDFIEYYHVVLVLVTLALILQVIVGVLALLVTHIKSNYTKHVDACSVRQWVSRCCCCATQPAGSGNAERPIGLDDVELSVATQTVLTDAATCVKALSRRLAARKLDSDLEAAKADILLRAATSETARRNIADLEQTKQLNAILHKQCAILQEESDDLKKKAILKRVTFLQHAINYILYFVFIFNIFITALSM